MFAGHMSTSANTQGEYVPRLESLDLFRFLAAMVVFVGHAVFLSSYGAIWEQSSWAKTIHTGAFAVDFFFVLSGFVLSGKTPTLRWIASRLIRLYPVYLAGLCLGALANLALSGSLLTTPFGLTLGFLGLQSLSSEHQTILNPPLWSLSVEIILIPLFSILFFIRKRLNHLYCALLISCLLASIFQNSIVVRSVPFFVLGSVLFHIKRPKPNIVFRIILLLYVCAYLLVGAELFINLSYSWSSLLIKLIVLTLLVYCLLGVKLGKRFAGISHGLGRRSYALYVVHGPLVGLALAFWKPNSSLTFICYIAAVLVSTSISTELLYRFVDIAAISKASKFLR